MLEQGKEQVEKEGTQNQQTTHHRYYWGVPTNLRWNNYYCCSRGHP